MHEGHRQRMCDRFAGGDSLYDHELLEMLLFNAHPRVNTNPIAHALLSNFGSLAGVFNAGIEQLMTVKGVGKGIATYIKINAEVYRRISNYNAGIAVLKNYEEFKTFATVRMRGRLEEVLEFYFLEKSGKVKRIFTFSDADRNKVEVGTDTISEIIAKEKPYGLLVAHNHLSGNSTPSANDDRFTGELSLICNINRVVLYDHCIYASDNNMYSYFADGKIDKIRKNFSFKGVVDTQFERLGEEKEDKK